jgi:DNA-binding response OmpR family regulator
VKACRLRILAIDDEPLVLRAIARALPHHDVMPAPDGRSALAALDAERFDVVLSDVNLPDISGVGIYEFLSRLYPGEEQRVVFMTGGAIREGAHAFLDGIANPRLHKPFTAAALERVIAAVLSEAQPVARARAVAE